MGGSRRYVGCVVCTWPYMIQTEEVVIPTEATLWWVQDVIDRLIGRMGLGKRVTAHQVFRQGSRLSSPTTLALGGDLSTVDPTVSCTLTLLC
jgi:hypothetical protein